MAESIKLPERLGAIANFIQNGASVIDVGTDHGYLPAYLAQNNLAKHIMASDMSGKSLKSARQTASRYGVSERIEFIEAPGLNGIYEEDVDTIVVAGLGGETIVSILSEAPWIKRCKTRLILQPQSKLEDLCGFLRTSKYYLKDADIVLDKGKHYAIILAGASDKPDKAGEFFADFSPEVELYSILARKRSPQFAAFLDSLILKNQSAVMSLKQSRPKKYEVMQAKLEELKNLRKAYELWQS